MSSTEAINNALVKFSINLYEKVLKQQKDGLNNTLMSPLSIYSACVLTMIGAESVTLRQMLDTLQVPHELRGGSLHESIGKHLLKQLASSKDVEISLANRLFLLQNFKVCPDFLGAASKHYDAAVENIAALSSLESKRQHINKWVSDNTKTKIPQLIPSGGLKQDVLLGIINALYFRGNWETPFNKEATHAGKFHCLDGSKIEIQQMSSHDRYPYAELPDLDAEAIKLPFKDDKWSFLVILPRQRNGLPNLLNELEKPGMLQKVLSEQFMVEKCEVYLPRFKLTECPMLDVKELLRECGMKQLFTKQANLSKISAEENLFVSDVFHKAILEVDESGATAAAATGMMVSAMCFMPEPTFNVDHPFFLAILCDDVPAFIGHVVKPEAN